MYYKYTVYAIVLLTPLQEQKSKQLFVLFLVKMVVLLLIQVTFTWQAQKNILFQGYLNKITA